TGNSVSFPNAVALTFCGVSTGSAWYQPSRALSFWYVVTFTPEEATVSARVAVVLSAPELPVNTRFALPAAALLPAASVTLCGVPGVNVNVAGDAVTPAGRPLRATLTVPVKPFRAVADNCTGFPAAPIV